MTAPRDPADDARPEDGSVHRHQGQVLGEATAPADDADTDGAGPGPASGAAGPAWPPAESEPDAHRS